LKRNLIAVIAFMTSMWAFAVPPGTNDEIDSRLQPFGEVCRAGDDCATAVASISSGPMNGQQVYDKFCSVCHAAGVGGAPILGDTAVWESRVAKGMDALMVSTLDGLNAMPPKGTCMACADDELSGAVTYMLDQL